MIRIINFLLIASISVSSSQAQSDKVKTTHEALVALYNYTDGDNWRNNSGWDINTVPSSMEEFNQWYGLTVSNGNLVEINLSGNGLDFDYRGNSWKGFGNLSDLKELDLSKNPDHWIDNNDFLKEVLKISGLEKLDLRGTRRSQDYDRIDILSEVAENLLNLKYLGINKEGFGSWMSPEIGNLKNLEHLDLSDNIFRGLIPPTVKSLSNLKYLNLKSSNDFVSCNGDTGFRDGIPRELFDLPNLEYLNLSNQRFLEDSIPPTIANLTNLKELNLSGTQWAGSIPPEIGNLAKLEKLDLSNIDIPRSCESHYRLMGNIPHEIANLKNLVYLNLSGNYLTGEIPSKIGDMESLKTLILSKNFYLKGELPSELGNLSNLERLDVGETPLSGAIPRSFYNLENIKSLNTWSTSLCAPLIYEFQYWLSNLVGASYITCEGAFFYEDKTVDQSYVQSQPISQTTLPEATSEVQSIVANYTLTPALPQGIKFDPSTRTISGTPTELSPAKMYSYKSHDSNNFRDSLHFSIEVTAQPVSTELDELPDEFTIHSNYPNPFQNSTSLVFDLPYPAQVGIELLDVMGRQVFTKPPAYFSAGRGIQIEIDGSSLPSGTYLYRLIATASEGDFSYMGQLLKIR